MAEGVVDNEPIDPGADKEPDPGLIRYCHRHLEPVRMRIKYQLAANTIRYAQCPICLHEAPIDLKDVATWRGHQQERGAA